MSRPPFYNHTREDSPATPCAECRAVEEALRAVKQPARKKWEYLRADNLRDEDLERFGEIGWEMCGAVLNGSSVVMWFKRELPALPQLPPKEPDPEA